MSIVEHIKLTLHGMGVLAAITAAIVLWIGVVLLVSWVFKIEVGWVVVGGIVITAAPVLGWCIGAIIKFSAE